MTVRGRLDPGFEEPEEEREQGWVIRHHEKEVPSPTQPEVRRRIRPKEPRYLGHIDKPALRSRSYGGRGRSDPRTNGRHLDWLLKMPHLVR